MRFKINEKKIVFYFILITGVALLWNLIVNTGELPGFFYLDPAKISIENLMYYTWQVQVTIALISISLTSLIIGRLDRKIYGQSVKEILMLSKKMQLTYIDKIILVILLSVVNLWFVMYGMLGALIVIFIISIIGVLDLIIDSYNILFNPEKYEEKVKEYINLNLIAFSKYQPNKLSNIIENIELNNKELIASNEVRNLEISIAYLIEMLFKLSNKEINKEKYFNEILLRIEKSIINTMKFSKNAGDIEIVINTINKIMNVSFDYKNKQYLIEELLNILISKNRENCSEETYNKINKYILMDVFDNIDLKTIEKSFISVCQFRCFYWVYKNDTLSGFVREEITNKFINLLVPSEFENSDTDEYFIRKLAIYYIAKKLIIHNDKEIFSVLLKCLYSKNAFSLNQYRPNKVYEIIITINIFIYYVANKEDACEDEFKKRVKNFLYFKVNNETKYNLNIKDFAARIGIYIWDCYKIIKDQMPKSDWEYSPSGAAKQLIITETIDEYFIFYSIINIEYYDYEEYINKNFDINICQTILEYFKSDGTLKNDVIENFNDFVKTYRDNFKGDEEEQLYNKMKVLFINTNRLYARLIIEQEKRYYEMHKVQDNIKKIKEDAIKKLKNNDFYNYIDNKNISGKKYWFETELLSTSVLAEEVYLCGKSYQELIVDSIEEIILDVIRTSAHKFTFASKDENKIYNLFNFITQKNFSVGSILNGKPSEYWSITYNETIDMINELKKFEEGISKHYYLANNKNEYIILMDKKFNIQIEVKQIRIQDISEEQISEIMNQLEKDSNNYYKINVVNDIYALFEENEAKEYFSYKFKTLDVSFEIRHNIKVNDAIILKGEH